MMCLERVSKIVLGVPAVPISALKSGLRGARESRSLIFETRSRKIGEVGVVPVVRATNSDEAARPVEAVLAGGISIIEITMTVPNANAWIKQLVHRYADEAIIGTVTILTPEHAKLCVDCGAAFLVSPGLSAAVLSTIRACDRLAIPGVLTPTELMNAHELGAKIIKIFPCGNLGGPQYLSSLSAPFPNIRLVPTGCVNVSNAADYIGAGAFALGVGAELVDVVALREGNAAKIVATARQLVETIRNARDKSKLPN